MSTELTARRPGVQITTMDDVARVSRMFAESGFFTDARDAAQCGVKIMAGAAWGIDPFTAMSGIFIIKNRPSVSAGLMAAAVKGHPKYDYRVRERSADACRIEFFEGAESLGVSVYTMEMAKRAGLTTSDMYRKHPEAMLFSRCMSGGVRTFTPDVFNVTVYTPEELGADVGEDGEVIDVPSRPQAPVERPALAAPVAEPMPEPAPQPEPAQATAAPAEPAATGPQLKKLAIVLKGQSLDRDQARSFLGWLFKRELASSTELTKAEASRVLDWTDDQWSAALVDYANELAGGVPEPDWSGVPVPPASDATPFDPNGRTTTRQKVAS
jgi:hypothetical protein